jgi:hypothetical protein
MPWLVGYLVAVGISVAALAHAAFSQGPELGGTAFLALNSLLAIGIGVVVFRPRSPIWQFPGPLAVVIGIFVFAMIASVVWTTVLALWFFIVVVHKA